ncbi:TIGR02117 family protein [Mesorhizobium sp. LHD-90]|uniref:TIGR02117 family protein n=1 Tax=Mesorhizobium sp. LHD-90 TaxID=3071414 RepID=UPI0027DF48A6|nr:TIGR02117 family protein [Mesorhizobium sp. LHD-90]MDQ6434401.1 TIGR02117 family protein [Mesorhizobium sp. LHD-90]
MKLLFRALGMIVGLFVLAVALGALVPRPLIAPAVGDEPELRKILVLSNPIHTDIAVPADDDVRRMFGFLREDGMPLDMPEAEYLVFGRGSREFYIATPTWDQLKPMPLLKGLTLDRAAMHINVAGPIPETHPDVTALTVSDREYNALLAFIRDSFQDDEEGPLIIPGAAYGPFDRFYEADGHFTALLGCNTWTARALREAGITTGLWNPLPLTLRWSLELYN